MSNDVEPALSPLAAFCRRHYRSLAALVLACAAFNLSFRLDREIVTEWDESLYAISAAETVAHGDWIATTFFGALDYYNTKPPLNVWLIAAAFHAFGVNLVSLRLPSVIAAWLTVLVLMMWSRRWSGPTGSLVAGVVLSTTFGFLYVHSGRSANPDALFTLLMLLVVVVLWAAADRPWWLVWTGPLLAATFLLRGLGLVMPLALVGLVLLADVRRLRERVVPGLLGAVLFAIPVGAWVIARWQIDEWQFIGRMVAFDFFARTTQVLDGHSGTALYYLNVLQKDQYGWLLAGVAALVLVRPSWTNWRRIAGDLSLSRYRSLVLGAWIVVALLIPTIMRTKVPWYLNSFFPIFALLVAAAITHAVTPGLVTLRRRQRVLVAIVVLVVIAAESRLIWYSFRMRGLDQSVQGLILDEQDRLEGRRVFQPRWPRAEQFVLEHIAKGQPVVEQPGDLMSRATRGDYVVLPRADAQGQPSCVRTNQRFALCEYVD